MILNILLESTWTASIIPMSGEPTFFAMKAFGNYDMRLPFVLAVLGATMGQMFNWGLGKILRKCTLPLAPQHQSGLTIALTLLWLSGSSTLLGYAVLILLPTDNSFIVGATLVVTFIIAVPFIAMKIYKKRELMQYEKSAAFFQRYGIYTLLLSWLPFFNVITLISGFFGTKPKLALALIMIGQAAHYGWYLF